MKRQLNEKDQLSQSLLKWIGKGSTSSKDQSRSRSIEASHSSVSQVNTIANSKIESGAEAALEYSMENNENMDVRYV
jgi:hypothetical protein